MSEYLCLTVLGSEGEPSARFRSRLYEFWTHMLRNRPADYEKVYAEAKEFESENGRVSRRYMIEVGAVTVILNELITAGIESLAVDEEDLYSQAEASSSEWFQLNH